MEDIQTDKTILESRPDEAQNTVVTGEKQRINGKFAPGVSGNPAGRPLGARSFTTKVKEALEKIAEGKDYTYEEAFIRSILKKAIVDGDSSTQRLIWNYLDGMPVQKLATDPENPFKIVIENYGDIKGQVQAEGIPETTDKSV